MSLVIIVVDRVNQTHSVYCDGQSCRGNNKIRTDANKICNINLPLCSVLIGTTGMVDFGRYLRTNFSSHFKESDLIYISDSDLFVERLRIVLSDAWDVFCSKNHVNESDDFHLEFGCVLSINGHLYYGESIWFSERSMFQVYEVSDRDYCAVGVDEVSALCMLDNGVNIDRIYKTIAKYNICVNNNIRRIENIKYS